MLFRWRTGALLLAVLSLSALADPAPAPKPGVVQSLDGHTFQGDITEDDKYVTITLHNITTRLDKRNVAKITYSATIDDQFSSRLAALPADDVKGRLDLATWANENQRPDLAVVALQEARKIDPTNRDAAIALDTAQRQINLDARQGAAPTAGATSKPAANTAPKASAMEYRLLADDEVNLIRQKEMSPDDPNIRVRMDNGVVNRYLEPGDQDAAAFRQLSVIQQAFQIMNNGDPKLINDVRVVTDPQQILDFKVKVYPLIASSCASTACHGGGQAGDFGLFRGTSTQAVYTNFYILQSYSKAIGGGQFHAIDRTVPDRSLVLEFMLPEGIADVAHPKVEDYRPRFRTRNDPGYQTILNWITNLNPIVPRYGIAVSPVVPPPPPDAGGAAPK